MVDGKYGHQVRSLAERVVASTGAPSPSSWPLAKRNEFWARFLAALDGGSRADSIAAWQASVTQTPNSIMAYRQTIAMAAVAALGQGM
jgi:hypothetical protein